MYKDDQGRFLTQCLFKENYEHQNLKFPAVFSLRDQDPDSPDQLPSFKKAFIESRDITGYKVSQSLLGSWDHMQKLLRAKWFLDHYVKWVEELEVMLKAEGLLKIQEHAKGEGSTSFQAAKYLSDKGWEPKRGRPTKAEKAKEAAKEKALEDALEEDMSRILTIVK
tara:strand:- start:173 stop:670 length:498 start_codon:yes stop_codon:yes gene_type:complete